MGCFPPKQQHTYHAIEEGGGGIEASVKMASVCDDCNGRLVLPKNIREKPVRKCKLK